MALLRELSPRVQQVSVDEAYVDLYEAGIELTIDAVTQRARQLLADIPRVTGGLTASVGIGSSKMLAKIASDLDKPVGLVVVAPGTELKVLAPLPVRAIGGIGPATATRLRTFGVETVADLQRMGEPDLVSVFGDSHGRGIYRLARAQDDREVEMEREAKSVSAEETFEVDVTDTRLLASELARMTTRVTGRLVEGASFARTVTIKVRQHDFSTATRSATLPHPTGDPEVIRATAQRLLDAVDVSNGLRLLGVGVSGFTTHAQEQFLFDTDEAPEATERVVIQPTPLARSRDDWAPGHDVRHDEYGAGWVWGSGLGRVTARFEGPGTPPGKVRTFASDDPQLYRADPPDWH